MNRETCSVAVEDSGTPSGEFTFNTGGISGSATVQLSAHWSPPVVSLLVPDGIRIDVTSTARSVFR